MFIKEKKEMHLFIISNHVIIYIITILSLLIYSNNYEIIS